jgi:pimeloyl-ACP methyl ester carboxylesterase
MEMPHASLTVRARAKVVLPEPIPANREAVCDVPRGGCLGYAEYGDPDGDPVTWFHATPGARKQFPPDAHRLAVDRRIRLIGVERPGTGLSTRWNYHRVADWADDVEAFADGLGLERFAVAGLSGGGPYVLAACHGLPDRVVAGAVLGGIGRPAVRRPRPRIRGCCRSWNRSWLR